MLSVSDYNVILVCGSTKLKFHVDTGFLQSRHTHFPLTLSTRGIHNRVFMMNFINLQSRNGALNLTGATVSIPSGALTVSYGFLLRAPHSSNKRE